MAGRIAVIWKQAGGRWEFHTLAPNLKAASAVMVDLCCGVRNYYTPTHWPTVQRVNGRFKAELVGRSPGGDDYAVTLHEPEPGNPDDPT